MKGSRIGFHVGPDFHVSSDQKICGFRVALRAVEGLYVGFDSDQQDL